MAPDSVQAFIQPWFSIARQQGSPLTHGRSAHLHSGERATRRSVSSLTPLSSQKKQSHVEKSYSGASRPSSAMFRWPTDGSKKIIAGVSAAGVAFFHMKSRNRRKRRRSAMEDEKEKEQKQDFWYDFWMSDYWNEPIEVEITPLAVAGFVVALWAAEVILINALDMLDASKPDIPIVASLTTDQS
eukprot:TRINITY_DN86198_c0_g1_i1.p1 TRINITY_DN86198_c0_g1~~TRINITY_DN86198_c0_g1_i1.p1  ORF type:complete len:200 (-),score=16.01 TRINITY_DN86198_c0_g1_i1:148-702(-)